MLTRRRASAAAALAELAGSAISGQALAQSTEPFSAQFELSSLLPENGGDNSQGFILIGVEERDHIGYPVSSAGDVNGDGIDDLIIGAQWADPNGIDLAGESYVVFGRDVCLPDFERHGVLDNVDIQAFVTLYLAFDPAADTNGDRLLDFGDINTFAQAYLDGC